MQNYNASQVGVIYKVPRFHFLFHFFRYAFLVPKAGRLVIPFIIITETHFNSDVYPIRTHNLVKLTI